MTIPQSPNAFTEPQMPPVVMQRAAPRPSRFVRPAIAVVVVAALGFAGGFTVANAMAKPVSPTTGNGQFGFGGPGASPGAGRQRNGFGGGATGTVSSVSSGQMTVTSASGAQRLVLLTSGTTVTEVSSTTKSVGDIANGTTVTVIGTANQDGSVTATQVIIGDAGFLGRGFGGGESPAPSGTP